MNVQTKYNILIVDDERSNLQVLNRILEPQHNVFVARSGQSALKKVENNKPDLILLDVIMPDMSGFEVLSVLKNSGTTRDIPVIFITGLDSAKNEEKGLFLGAVDYIIKPFHGSVVKARIETHLKIIEQMRTIERFGLIDALTGIPNRRSFDSQLNVEWGRAAREKTPISMLMIDIDNFKIYNDTYGHPQGDVLLKAVAKTFVLSLKRTTDLVFRWGGEEFAVILPNTDINGALKIAENIRSAVESLVVTCAGSGCHTAARVSIGVVEETPAIGSLTSDFISKADKALYAAKEAGRNRVCQ